MLWTYPATGYPYFPHLSHPTFSLFTITYYFGISDSVVEMMGFEPMTPCLQGRCSPS